MIVGNGAILEQAILAVEYVRVGEREWCLAKVVIIN
jgi:hypothetical protein